MSLIVMLTGIVERGRVSKSCDIGISIIKCWLIEK